jgi:3-hydroxy-D-aspartate aldolase
MTTRPPARIGDSIEAIDTPALVIDLDALERNLRKMADFAKQHNVRLRPHAKMHKSPIVARMQMALGAIGVCCQKVSEAEAMVNGGVDDVLVSNQIVLPHKLERLAALARRAKVSVCVDDAENVAKISQAAAKFGAAIEVLVEVNVGANRCGVAPGEPALKLAQKIAASPGLSLGGIQAYHGSAQHVRSFDERRAAIAKAEDMTRATRDLLRSHGLACRTVGGAGTGSYAFEGAGDVFNELQVGSYAFMDVDYAKNRAQDGGAFNDFEHALFVLSHVMSRAVPNIAVTDAGLKAMTFECGMPWVCDWPGVEYVGPSDEHGKLSVPADSPLKLGDRVWLIPPHCDPCVNLHDWYVCVRGGRALGRVEALWPVAARGMGW